MVGMQKPLGQELGRVLCPRVTSYPCHPFQVADKKSAGRSARNSVRENYHTGLPSTGAYASSRPGHTLELVNRAIDWKWSSASWYLHGKQVGLPIRVPPGKETDDEFIVGS